MASSDKLKNALRQPPPPLPESEHHKPTPQRTIRFRHPGYPDAGFQNVLLVLYAFDSTDGGLHYGTAFLACAIVAVNAFNGYMTETRDGDELEMEWDELLQKDDYYFHVPSTENDAGEGPICSEESGPVAEKYQYPVYPTFDHWSFPHMAMPANWPKQSSPAAAALSDLDLAPPSASSLAAHVVRRDGRCLITSSKDYIESAHLCPLHKEEWFKRNGMAHYNIKRVLGNCLLDDVSNAIALRSDLHTAFDNRRFLISYKNSSWAIHFLELTNELGGLYHNTPIKLANNVSPLFLFVRFAWAIFPSLRSFLDNRLSRRVCIRVEDENSNLEEIKVAGVKELQGLINPPKSRNPSPTKRQRQSKEDEAEVREDDECCDGKRRYASSDAISEPRGRKRCRTSSPQSAKVINIKTSPSSSSKSATLVPSRDLEKNLTDFERKQLRWLRTQRPKDPQLLCCDYTEAERANRLGLPGKREHGGSHLCLECRGLEYLEEMPELPDGWQDEWEVA